MSGTCLSMGIGVWAANNLSSTTASATASNIDDPLHMEVGIGLVDAGTTATCTGTTVNGDRVDATNGDI
jgi:hypothetical protein